MKVMTIISKVITVTIIHFYSKVITAKIINFYSYSCNLIIIVIAFILIIIT